jgi:hypothetical protein
LSGIAVRCRENMGRCLGNQPWSQAFLPAPQYSNCNS